MRTIAALVILAGATFVPRCATRSAYDAASPTPVMPSDHPEPAVIPGDNSHPPAIPSDEPQPPVIPGEARDPIASGHPEQSDGSAASGRTVAAARNDKGETAPGIASAPADAFRETIQPILSARCGQCHDPGGRMYARLPFDDPKVVSSHSTAILRRLKGEDRTALEKWVAGLAAATDPR